MTENVMDSKTRISDRPTSAHVDSLEFAGDPRPEGLKKQEKAQAGRK